ncbi:Protein HOL1 [Hanseniaspora opuntiae]|uniref:Protein HOL1 n=1 Tax=Hanseniaspora opuntiae TaxID=211096 RepID=A0A1E5R8H4_9ASCO|nr:Protein HOL1 [Hanseniaspora opuntiae]
MSSTSENEEYIDPTQYTDIYHKDYVPGTINILLEKIDEETGPGTGLKTSKNGMILMPQPSDSPNDPLNWSYLRKTWHFFLMAYITAFTAATSNMAGAASDYFLDNFNISYNQQNTGAGVLFLGIGWGTLFLAPFANLYGRKISYLICITLGLFGALWFGVTNDASDAIWSQLFVGISESCAEAQVQLSLSDIFFQHQLGSVLTVYIMATSIGTFLGPLIAGYIADLTWFRWAGFTALIISFGTLVVFVVGCEETYFDRSLYKTGLSVFKSRETYGMMELDGIVMKDDTVVSVEEKEKEKDKKPSDLQNVLSQVYSNTNDNVDEYAKDNLDLIDGSTEKIKSYWKRMAIITPASNLRGWGFKQYFQYLLLNIKMFAFPAVWLSGIFWGWQDVLLSFYLTIEEDNYYDPPWNYSDAAVAIMNVPTLIGAVIGCLYAGILSDYFVVWLSKKRGGIYECEYRLWFSIAVFFISPAGLLMFGIASAKNFTNWRCAYVGLGLIGFGWGCAGDIAMAYLMDAYPEMVLEGMVCTSLINNNLACIFTFTCSDWLSASGLQNTFIALAVLTAFFTFLAWPMYIYGKRARKWSKDRYVACIALRDGF